jgi:group I intron endonuclease
MEEKGCIYLITNIINGKMYVGQTKYESPIKRYERHWLDSKKRAKNYNLYNAMNKYGKESFKLEILCIVPREALNNMECYWAEQLETYVWDNPGGYNMVWCGNQPCLNIKQSPELIEKRFAPLRGRKQSEEQIQKARKEHIKGIMEKGAVNVKLNPESVMEILQLCRDKVPQTEVAKKFNVQDSVITRILKGERWSHLTGIVPVIKEGPPRVKLGIDIAKEIFNLYKSGFGSYDKIKDLFNVNKTTVAGIVKGKLYPEIHKNHIQLLLEIQKHYKE